MWLSDRNYDSQILFRKLFICNSMSRCRLIAEKNDCTKKLKTKWEKFKASILESRLTVNDN